MENPRDRNARALLLAIMFAALALTNTAQARLPQAPTRLQLSSRAEDAAHKAAHLKDSAQESDEAPRLFLQLMSGVEERFGEATAALYVPDLFGFPILPQPEGEHGFVSAKADRVTQFGLAARHGVVGILAHNYLAGKDFYRLQLGQQLWIAASRHKVQLYQVIQIEAFQKIMRPGQPDRYVELSNDRVWSVAELFARYYTGRPHVVLQTCLEKNGRLDWGLTFIVAAPANQ